MFVKRQFFFNGKNINLALPFASKWNIFHYMETRIEQNPKDIKNPAPSYVGILKGFLLR